jgi:iron(II)-dependent oxidoreductase
VSTRDASLVDAASELARLDEARARTLAWVLPLDDDAWCAWPDADFSPIAWHLGHLAFTEASWVLERLLGDARLSAPYATRFAQDGRPKHERARGFDRTELLDYLATVRAAVREQWPRLNAEHELVRDGYLAWFLACHEHQHRETIAIVRARTVAASEPPALPFVERSRRLTAPTQSRSRRLTPPTRSRTPPTRPRTSRTAVRVELDGGCVRLGTDERLAYDNERPAIEVDVGPFAIDTRLVSAGEWLAFVNDDGYRREALWTREGWAWRARAGVEAPSSWSVSGSVQTSRGESVRGVASGAGDEPRFVVATPAGWRAFDPDAPVFGISAHEADAYARWRGARLPTEAEWELAASLGTFEERATDRPHAAGPLSADATDRVWEWSADTFLPRPGFVAFPYRGYSEPWFEDHRVMKGGSFVTDAAIATRTFRNFYVPEMRVCFAGLRLAWESGSS